MGEVIKKMYNGQTPSRADQNNWNGDINWLTSGELNRSVVTRTTEKITMVGKERALLKIVPARTFVMAITGLEAAGTRGNCAKLAIDTTLNQSCMALYTNDKLLNSDFLFQWYRKIGEMYGLKYTQGTKQQSYNAELIKILPITLPRIAEQQKIEKVLTIIDNLLDVQKRKLEVLKQLKQALLQQMFPQKDEINPRVRFANFHDDWEQRKLSEIAKISRGLTYKPSDVQSSGTRILRSSNIDGEKFILKSNDVFVKPECVNVDIVKSGDILVTAANGSSKLVGKHAVISGIENSVAGGFMLIVRVQNPYFINSLLSTEWYKKFISISVSGGNGSIGNLSKRDLENQLVKIPVKVEQSNIELLFKEVEKLLLTQGNKMNYLNLLKQSLLQKMFI